MASINNGPDGAPHPRRSLWQILIGPARDLRDPAVFRTLSLIAFLAWVGLGSDGLSSSCYGPEEAFLALGTHKYLAVFLALMTATTVFVISASYAQLIDLFPAGGGGYLVATRLLGPYPGLVSGSALVIDYVLTISISIASGVDAVFSFLPVEWLPFKFWLAVIVVGLMIVMNLRGVKESVLSLVPIFLAFVAMHAWLVGYALVSHAWQLPAIAHGAVQDARLGIETLGFPAMAAIFFRAYSLGGGTYTGIEAVSNGLPLLRQPRAETGKRTMVYMSLSLAFIAGGILLGYLLLDVEPRTGRTLNAVLFEQVAQNWTLGGFSLVGPIVTFTLITEGALLFVAAQTGFIGGPRVLATMAADRWVPRRFANLSGRLVGQDGVVTMGLGAILILVGTEARVDLLVILYAINVFVTFTLSQLGMSAHWWNERRSEPRWVRKLAINGLGCAFTLFILVMTVTLKFDEGGWITVAITGSLIGLSWLVRRHYQRIGRAVVQLEADILPKLYGATKLKPPARDPEAPTAILLVNGYNGLGLATLFDLTRLFKDQFKNVVFVAVGEVDSDLLRGPEEIEQVKSHLDDDLNSYCELAADLGLHAERRAGLGAEVVEELHGMCRELADEFPNAVFFAGKLIFTAELEGFVGRFLHNQTAVELQELLQLDGLSLVILPVRVSGAGSTMAAGQRPAV